MAGDERRFAATGRPADPGNPAGEAALEYRVQPLTTDDRRKNRSRNLRCHPSPQSRVAAHANILAQLATAGNEDAM